MPFADPDAHQDEMRAYRRKWYAQNAERAKQAIYERRAKLRAWFDEHRSALSCVDCGEGHIACLEFHHVDPASKDIEVSLAVHNGWSIARIEAELAKCRVLCANCHRKLHYELKGLGHDRSLPTLAASVNITAA